MKLTAKLFLIVSLFCSIALADDGDMGPSGGNGCTENCLVETREATNDPSEDSEQKSDDDSILEFIKHYLVEILG